MGLQTLLLENVGALNPKSMEESLEPDTSILGFGLALCVETHVQVGSYHGGTLSLGSREPQQNPLEGP